jgi:hypothetical protein
MRGAVLLTANGICFSSGAGPGPGAGAGAGQGIWCDLLLRMSFVQVDFVGGGSDGDQAKRIRNGDRTLVPPDFTGYALEGLGLGPTVLLFAKRASFDEEPRTT